MICPNCQKETPQGNCCMHCGAVLNASSIPSVTTGNANQPKKKKGGAVIAIILAVIVVIGIIGALVPSGATGTTVLEKTDADGTVSTLTYYYKNDVVYKLVDSATLPLAEGTTQAQIDMIKANLDLEFAGAKGLSCCNIQYSNDATSFTLTVTSTDLDQIPNIKALSDAGIIDTDGTDDLISFKLSKEALIADGYKVISENNE